MYVGVLNSPDKVREGEGLVIRESCITPWAQRLAGQWWTLTSLSGAIPQYSTLTLCPTCRNACSYSLLQQIAPINKNNLFFHLTGFKDKIDQWKWHVRSLQQALSDQSPRSIFCKRCGPGWAQEEDITLWPLSFFLYSNPSSRLSLDFCNYAISPAVSYWGQEKPAKLKAPKGWWII